MKGCRARTIKVKWNHTWLRHHLDLTKEQRWRRLNRSSHLQKLSHLTKLLSRIQNKTVSLRWKSKSKSRPLRFKTSARTFWGRGIRCPALQPIYSCGYQKTYRRWRTFIKTHLLSKTFCRRKNKSHRHFKTSLTKLTKTQTKRLSSLTHTFNRSISKFKA